MPAGYVFLRPSGARYHGHVGWGFDLAGGGALVGGVELPNKPFRLWMSPATMGFWALRVADPMQAMSGPPHWAEWHSRYDLMKRLPVRQPNERAALRAVQQVRRQHWRLIGHNCMDAAVAILTAYGVRDLPRTSLDWGPIHFFNDVKAPSHAITPAIETVDATIYSEPGLGGARYMLLTTGGDPDLAGRWTATASSLVVRAGHVAIYPDPGYRGEPIVAGPGTIRDAAGRDLPIGSVIAAAEPFDAHQPPQSLPPFQPPSGPQLGTSPNMPHSIRGRGTVPQLDDAQR